MSKDLLIETANKFLGEQETADNENEQFSQSFSLNFDMSNAAFDENAEQQVADILNKIAEDFKKGITEGNVKDINGNTVGKWKIDVKE